MVFSPLAGNVYDVQRPLLNVMKQAKDRIPQGEEWETPNRNPNPQWETRRPREEEDPAMRGQTEHPEGAH